MKKILLLATASILSFCNNSWASGYANWNFSASVPSTVNASSYTSVCPGAELAIDVHFDAGMAVPPPTTSSPYSYDQFRYYIEINDGGGYSAVLNKTAINGLPITTTVRNFSGTIKVPITRWNGGTTLFHVKIERRFYDSRSATFTGCTPFDDFYPAAGDNSPLLHMLNNIANMDFKINGQTVPQTGVMNYIRCNFETLNITDIINAGDGATATIENGNYSGGVFYPSEGESTPYSILPHMLLYPLSLHKFLHAGGGYYWPVSKSYSGYIKVKVTTTSPCPPYTVTKEIIVKVTDVYGLVEFSLYNALTGNSLPIEKNLPMVNIGYQASVTSAVSVPGWQGASTGGVFGGSLITGTVTGVSSNIKVRRVNSTTGTDIGGDIVNFSQSSALSAYRSFDLKSAPIRWFSANHSTIAPWGSSRDGEFTFKVTVTVTTTECGDISNYSYFKIIDGPVGNAEYWRTTNENAAVAGEEHMQQAIMAYPNPSNKFVLFDYGNIKNESNTVNVLLSDMMGHKVLSATTLQASNHIANLNIENLPVGNYLYNVEIAGKFYSGRITKN